MSERGPESQTVIKTASEIRIFVCKLLRAAGASERNANRMAESLVSANLSGVDTHGVWHLPGYLDAIKGGEVNAAGSPSILRETPNTAVVSGNWTFGQVAAAFATEIAIEKAQSQEVALVSLVQAYHIGRLGEYVEMAAAAGLVSMVWAGGFGEDVPAAVPYGGRKRALHTNPIAMGFPSDEKPAMMFDFATTVLSGVKLCDARDEHRQLPLGCIVDKDGNPTADPNAFFAGGAHVPFGGHKGYAFMLAAEYLGHILTGSDGFAREHLGGPIFGHSGTLIIVFRADLFQAADEYHRRAREMEQRIRAVPPAPGFREVLMPGDVESRSRMTREQDGIPIPKRIWEKLVASADALGVTA